MTTKREGTRVPAVPPTAKINDCYVDIVNGQSCLADGFFDLPNASTDIGKRLRQNPSQQKVLGELTQALQNDMPDYLEIAGLLHKYRDQIISNTLGIRQGDKELELIEWDEDEDAMKLRMLVIELAEHRRLTTFYTSSGQNTWLQNTWLISESEMTKRVNDVVNKAYWLVLKLTSAYENMLFTMITSPKEIDRIAPLLHNPVLQRLICFFGEAGNHCKKGRQKTAKFLRNYSHWLDVLDSSKKPSILSYQERECLANAMVYAGLFPELAQNQRRESLPLLYATLTDSVRDAPQWMYTVVASDRSSHVCQTFDVVDIEGLTKQFEEGKLGAMPILQRYGSFNEQLMLCSEAFRRLLQLEKSRGKKQN